MPENKAGSEFQCPKCGRLVSVPTLDELHTLSSDGTYAVDASPIAAENDRLATLGRAYRPGTRDDAGEDIDLRTSVDDLKNVGDITPEAPEREPVRLKYDPVTGELIEELPLAEREFNELPPEDDIPLAQPAMRYATRHTEPTAPTIASLPGRMFAAYNLVVLVFIFFFHLFCVGGLFVGLQGLIFVLPIPIGLFFGIIGHYSVIIHETGPNEFDELPRPLGNFSFGEDIWDPFVHTMFAVAYCFAPALLLIAFFSGKWVMPVSLALELLGGLLFPAVLLTASTSGVIVNLRPDRVLGVISAIGSIYWLIAGMFLAGIFCYLGGLAASMVALLASFTTSFSSPGFLPPGWFGLLMLAFGIYLLHFMAWALGLCWRDHHEQFPWVGQRHIRSPLKMTRQVNQMDAARAAAMVRYQQRQTELRANRRR